MSEKSCVCSGIRRCLWCETNDSNDNEDNCLTFLFCSTCGDKAFVHRFGDHSLHCPLVESMVEWTDFVQIDGIYVQSDVITEGQESALISSIDSIAWIDSQSGRRKQDFGPKANFKRRKVKSSAFTGLPQFDVRLLATIRGQLADKSILNDFIAVEVCHLEYSPSNGSSIDPHFDDFWLWGPRLVTVNLLSSTVLTLHSPAGALKHRISIPVPKRCLVVLSGDSRYKYKHSIRRQDIHSRRVAITYRELSEQFLPSGALYESTGKAIIDISFNELIY